MPFIPHTKEDIKTMLATIGVATIEDLFDEIPQTLRSVTLDKIPQGMNELMMIRLMQQRGKQNQQGLCFIGAGAYEHFIPAAVWDIVTRGEWMTAYTPYQAEASQGSLQLIYEYQTMMASLMGMEVTNASLYDGASSLAEAILMALRCQPKKPTRVLLPKTIHPHYRQTVHAILSQQKIEIVEIPYDEKTGITELNALEKYTKEPFSVLAIPQPNFFGCLEKVDELTDWAHTHGALTVACVNPFAMTVIKEPGQWGEKGADVACGEGQVFGVPLACGGPYFGFLASRQQFVRQMPGRIVGRTIDAEGKAGFTLTLQAREQHIRRGKANSNICTNQGLLVAAATIYMSLLGPQGLKKAAGLCHHNTRYLVEKLKTISDVEKIFSSPYFHEIVLKLKRPVQQVLKDLVKIGIHGGYDLTEYYPELGNCLLVCATETKTEEDLIFYAEQLGKYTSHS